MTISFSLDITFSRMSGSSAGGLGLDCLGAGPSKGSSLLCGEELSRCFVFCLALPPGLWLCRAPWWFLKNSWCCEEVGMLYLGFAFLLAAFSFWFLIIKNRLRSAACLALSALALPELLLALLDST